jgi:Tfp pilus assembly protein PilZ
MRTILLEDDPILFRGLECSLLRREELRIVTAGSPEALLESSRRERPDLVVLRDTGDASSAPDIVEQIEAIPDSPPCVLSAAKPDREALLARIHEHLDLPARRAPRRRCRLRVRSTRGDDQRTGITRDLSEAGVFVAMDDPFELSSDILLAFKGHGMRQAVKVGGRVVRSVPPAPGSERLPGMAVRFNDEERLSREVLDALLRSGRETGRPA